MLSLIYIGQQCTTDANYEMLLSEKQKTEGKQTLVAVAGVAAGAAIAYTILDAFAFHLMFPADVKAAYNLQNKWFEIAVGKGF